jgi:hypothetical protein
MNNGDEREFEFEIPADYGDLVTVDGYDRRFFMVIAYQLTRHCTPEEEYNETVYELLDAHTGEYLEADGEDVEFVTDAVNADEYLAQVEAPVQPPRMPGLDFDLSEFFGGGVNMFGKKPQEPRKPTARELSAQEAEKRKAARKEKAARIDDLLDQRNWYSAALERTNNEEFGDKIAEIDSELKSLSEK